MNPFVIKPPHKIAFSGGRTSAYMLRRHLDAHGGKLPDGVEVIFCNTGKEREETLRFIERCSLEWDVPVTWLEYRFRPGEKRSRKHWFEVVNYATASRNGEPFEQLIAARSFLPNVVSRFCTGVLKIRTAQRYLRNKLGKPARWTKSIGLRADEPGRIRRLLASHDVEYEVPVCPLADAGVTRSEVNSFWDKSHFDLEIPSSRGNCDLCFLKGQANLLNTIREKPDLAEWWARMEATVISRKKSGSRFRKCGPGYSGLAVIARSQLMLPFPEEEGDGMAYDCFCG